MTTEKPVRCSRDSVKDIWGPRTPFLHQWPTRVDEHCIEEPERWFRALVSSAGTLFARTVCFGCGSKPYPSNGCGLDIGVKDDKVVGVRGRAQDRENKARLGPKGLNG